MFALFEASRLFVGFLVSESKEIDECSRRIRTNIVPEQIPYGYKPVFFSRGVEPLNLVQRAKVGFWIERGEDNSVVGIRNLQEANTAKFQNWVLAGAETLRIFLKNCQEQFIPENSLPQTGVLFVRLLEPNERLEVGEIPVSLQEGLFWALQYPREIKTHWDWGANAPPHARQVLFGTSLNGNGIACLTGNNCLAVDLALTAMNPGSFKRTCCPSRLVRRGEVFPISL